MEKKKQHNFVHTSKSGMAENSEYILIYCTKCGQVSYDQSKKGKEEIKECI